MGSGRLDSWKAIAAYLRRDERTVRRWEKEGLPIHRHLHAKKASIYAYTTEVDQWWNRDRSRLEDVAAARGPRRRLALVLGTSVLVVAAAGAWIGFGNRLLERPAASQIASIAVLPLENLSGDPQQDYFADGITEALITELGRIRTLRVVSRSSVMVYKGRRKALDQVAQELKVDAVVEGAVLREGGRVRVTAQLIRVRPERQVWADRYEREISSILALQADLAHAIAGEVHAKLTLPELAPLQATRQVDPDAYEAYLKGRYHWNKASGTALLQARVHFEEAIDRDPRFAHAYVGLANTYAWAYRWDAPSLPAPRDAFPRAKAAALKAIALDATLAEAHASLAYIKEAYDWDWEGAERDYRRAIEFNPSYPAVRHWYSLYLAIPRRFDEAFAQMTRAEELDPLSRAVRRGKGWLYLWSGEYDRAIEQWRMTLELDADFPQAHYALAIAYARKGMYDDAIGSHRKAIALAGETPRTLAILAHAYGKAGQKAEALQILGDLSERAKREYVSGYHMAIGHMGAGNKEEALRWLEKAFQERDPWLGEMPAASFWLDELRSDPRYQDLLRRLRLPT
jgi:TolB-like protein/Tfp pilus assembly protein PilF